MLHPTLVALAVLAAGALSCRRAPPARTADWAPVMPGHRVAEGTPRPVRWSLRDGCSLSYEWQIAQRIHPRAEARRHPIPVTGIDASGRAEGAARGGVLTLRVSWRELRHVTGDSISAPQRDEGIAAPVMLRVAQGSLREVDGPTSTWAAYGTFHGLVRFFPSLPEGTRVGAVTPWRFEVYPAHAGFATDARRGGARLPTGARVDPAPATAFAATARLARWIRVDDDDVAVIETEAAREERQALPQLGPDASVRTRWTSRGEHLVSARSGRLLLARYDDLQEIRGAGAGAGNLSQDHRTHGELRLVSACDGVTLRSPVPALTPADRAVLAVTTLRNALAQNDRAATLAALAPSLRTRHGDDALWRLLSGFVQRHGALSLGMTELLHEGGVTPAGADAWRVRLLGRCEACPARRTSDSLAMRVVLADGVGRVAEIRASRAQGVEVGDDLLRVDDDLLRDDADPTDAGVPAAPAPPTSRIF
ncbi:MAG: hypothetical protein U0325_09845 [Polyangiales bacterium]